jgi:hypothetical protein
VTRDEVPASDEVPPGVRPDPYFTEQLAAHQTLREAIYADDLVPEFAEHLVLCNDCRRIMARLARLDKRIGDATPGGSVPASWPASWPRRRPEFNDPAPDNGTQFPFGGANC